MKRIITLFLSLMMICLLPITAFAQEVSESDVPSKAHEIKDAKDLAILEVEWKAFLQENPNSTEAEQDAHLLAFINNGGLENNSRGLGDYLPGYGNLNAAERELALAHPVQAIKVYNAANTATDKTIEIYGYNGWQDNSDAFRHCLWNALMKKSIGVDAAEAWATAHEYDSSGIDKEMDLYNNSIGRSVYVDGKTEAQIVNAVKDKVRYGYCRRIVNGSLVATNGDGMY